MGLKIEPGIQSWGTMPMTPSMRKGLVYVQDHERSNNRGLSFWQKRKGRKLLANEAKKEMRLRDERMPQENRHEVSLLGLFVAGVSAFYPFQTISRPTRGVVDYRNGQRKYFPVYEQKNGLKDTEWFATMGLVVIAGTAALSVPVIGPGLAAGVLIAGGAFADQRLFGRERSRATSWMASKLR